MTPLTKRHLVSTACRCRGEVLPVPSIHVFVMFLSSTRPWDPLNDLIQFEKDGCIQTKVRHRTPMVRSGSLISLSNQGPRRDNCKCQVGRPDWTPHLKKPSSSPPQPPSAQCLLQHLHVASSRCRHHCCHFCSSSGLCPFCLYGRERSEPGASSPCFTVSVLKQVPVVSLFLSWIVTKTNQCLRKYIKIRKSEQKLKRIHCWFYNTSTTSGRTASSISAWCPPSPPPLASLSSSFCMAPLSLRMCVMLRSWCLHVLVVCV